MLKKLAIFYAQNLDGAETPRSIDITPRPSEGWFGVSYLLIPPIPSKRIFTPYNLDNPYPKYVVICENICLNLA